jgi:serine/threonine-protein kinase
MGPVAGTGGLLASRYRLGLRLGRGGFGEVWQATDLVLRREVAVKTTELPPGDSDVARRFEREAHALARLDHPNVVAVYDSGVDGEAGYLVMPMLSGPTLDSLVAAGPLPLPLAVEYGRQAAAGLAAAHAAGLVHRDVSPANLILHHDTVKIVDFGVALMADSSRLTVTGTVFATPNYVSPEQAAGGRADARSDLYGLGAVLYALVAGEPPFSAEHPLGLIQHHLSTAPPRLRELRPDAPAGLERLVVELMAKDPGARPASATSVERRLAEIAHGLQPEAPTLVLDDAPTRRLTAPLPRPASGRRRAVVALALTATLLGVGAAAGLALLGRGGHGAPPPARAAGSTAAARRPATPAATTATEPVPPPTITSPSQAVTAFQAAVLEAQRRGQLDAAAAADLEQGLADLSAALDRPNGKDAARKLGSLEDRVAQLADSGRLSAAAANAIMAPLNRLAALLPALPQPPGHGRGKEHGNGNGNGGDNGQGD